MPQVSKYRLDKDLETQMFQKFWVSVARLQDASMVSSFFSDLLSDTEAVMLAKRFTIAILLLRGKRPVEIKSILHVTYSTIGSVSSWVKNAKPKTRLLLEQIIKEGKWESFLDSIDGMLEKLPPRYNSDWVAAGKAKWKKKRERQARQSIR
jgi:uncharacterized protein YerC